MIRPTIQRWATSVLVMLGAGLLGAGAVAGCTGDEFTEGGDGGGGGTGVGTPTTTSTGDVTTSTTTTSSGGECAAGCIDGGGECREEQSVEHCGLGGSACQTCPEPETECQEADCDGGSCKIRNATDGQSCSDGACLDGQCVDVEVCLEAGDEDDNGKEGCADDICRNANYACSDGTEDGFSGPFLVVASPGEPSCPQGLEQVGGLSYAIEAGTCGCIGACEVEVERGDVAACLVGAATEVLVPGDCAAWPTNGTQALAVTPSCTASPAKAPEVDVAGLATCALPDFGCNEGEACMPPLPPPGAGGNLLCLTAPGDVRDECPSGWNIQRLASDSAEVECECACDLDAAEACAGGVTTWTDAACSMCGKDGERCSEVPAPADCTPLGDTAATHIRYDADAEEPPAASGAPSLAGSATTFCCIEYPQLPLE